MAERPGLTRGTLTSALPTARAVTRRTAARETLERRVILTIVSVSAVGAIALLGLRIARSNEQDRARVTIDQTFARVHARQREYRSLLGRFASWPELKGRGVELGPRQSALAWNADQSHWFMSIRDVDSGLICDRTGEIFDEEWSERVSVCRPQK